MGVTLPLKGKPAAKSAMYVVTRNDPAISDQGIPAHQSACCDEYANRVVANASSSAPSPVASDASTSISSESSHLSASSGEVGSWCKNRIAPSEYVKVSATGVSPAPGL